MKSCTTVFLIPILKFTDHFLILAALLCLAVSCKDDDDSAKNPVDQLPPATQEGAFTFGCLVNGEPFVVTNSYKMTAIYQGGILQIGSSYEEEGIDQSIIIWLEQDITVKEYFLDENFENVGFFRNHLIDCGYETYSPNSGSIHILLIDQSQFLVSGTFDFEAVSSDCQDTVRITDGRFDLQYIP